MTNIEKNVSEDPAAESVPVNPEPTGAPGQDVHQSPVVGGLEAKADDPGTAEPIEPHRLVGERSARGSVENPG
jgi:hypothetical protein